MRVDFIQGNLVEVAAGALSGSRSKSVIGFYLGGWVANLAAERQKGFAASVYSYDGKIAAYADEVPLCPMQMCFGEEDHCIPFDDVETTREKRPDCDIHIYPAGHSFNCDERGSYHAKSAAPAWERSLGR